MTTKQFNKLSKSKKAVLVAEDVLAQIKAKKYIVNTEIYISSQNNIRGFKGDIKEQFDTLKPCTVCALGSMLLSATHLGNKLTFDDLNISGSDIQHLKNNNVISLFKSIFKSKQLLLIETAFEGYDPFKNLRYYPESLGIYSSDSDRFGTDVLNQKLTLEECISCTKFFRKYKNQKNRLIVICNNIIKNSGKFTLQK